MVQLLSKTIARLTSPRPIPALPLTPLEPKTGIVTIKIQPNRVGQVRFQGAWWSARCTEPIAIETEAIVYIMGRMDSTTLLVQPIANPPAKT